LVEKTYIIFFLNLKNKRWVQGSLIHGPKKPCLVGFVLDFFGGSMIHGDPTYKNGERINERKVKHALGLPIGCMKFLFPKEFGIRVKLGSKSRCSEPTPSSKDSNKVKLDLGPIPK
jgi:hypothetical protein